MQVDDGWSVSHTRGIGHPSSRRGIQRLVIDIVVGGSSCILRSRGGRRLIVRGITALVVLVVLGGRVVRCAGWCCC